MRPRSPVLGRIALLVSSALVVATSVLAAPVTAATTAASLSLRGPVLRVAGGVALLADVDVRCPQGHAEAVVSVSVQQTVNPKLVQTSYANLVGTPCDGKTHTMRVPVPVLANFGPTGVLPGSAWSSKPLYATGQLAYCVSVDSSTCTFLDAPARVLKVQAAQTAQEKGRFLQPGTTATVNATVTSRAAGAIAFVKTSVGCRPGVPFPLSGVDVQILQVHGSEVRISSSSVSRAPVCDGATHLLRVAVSPDTVPFSQGPAFVLIGDDYQTSDGAFTNRSLVWSPVQVRNPAVTPRPVA